jgi:hypothetical protein
MNRTKGEQKENKRERLEPSLYVFGGPKFFAFTLSAVQKFLPLSPELFKIKSP